MNILVLWQHCKGRYNSSFQTTAATVLSFFFKAIHVKDSELIVSFKDNVSALGSSNVTITFY